MSDSTETAPMPDDAGDILDALSGLDPADTVEHFARLADLLSAELERPETPS